MTRTVLIAAAAGLMLGSLVLGQSAPEKKTPADSAPAASELADALIQRLSDDLRVKTVVGKPVIVGSVTLIPILMIDISFGGAGLAAPGGAPGGAPQANGPAGDGFLMTGEARPLGFVVITKKGTRFINVAKAPTR